VWPSCRTKTHRSSARWHTASLAGLAKTSSLPCVLCVGRAKEASRSRTRWISTFLKSARTSRLARHLHSPSWAAGRRAFCCASTAQLPVQSHPHLCSAACTGRSLPPTAAAHPPLQPEAQERLTRAHQFSVITD
jgi:hypothetical protein